LLLSNANSCFVERTDFLLICGNLIAKILNYESIMYVGCNCVRLVFSITLEIHYISKLMQIDVWGKIALIEITALVHAIPLA